MRKSPLFIGVVVLAAILLLVIYGIAVLAPIDPERDASPQDAGLTPLERPNVDFGNPVIGAMDAPVTIVEFGDYQCPACADIREPLKLVLLEFSENVRFVWKDLPNVGAHSESVNAAVAARCAETQGAFWEYHDLLFDRQASIVAANYLPFAAELGLDLDDFQECISEQRTLPIIQRDREEAIRLRVDATPYIFINSRRVTGAVSYEQLKGFVESELSKARADAARAAEGTDVTPE